jgi:hypothetical protein
MSIIISLTNFSFALAYKVLCKSFKEHLHNSFYKNEIIQINYYYYIKFLKNYLTNLTNFSKI